MQKVKRYLKINWHFVLILLLGLSVSWPLFKQGYFSHQDDLHIIRLLEMKKCLVDFQIPCRWTPDMAWGNGMPLFNFYGPSIYYLGGVISFLIGFIGAAKFLFLLSLVLGGIAMYLLVESIWGKNPALVSAFLYTLAPYKALDVYVRGALSEAFALSLIPFVFYFFCKQVKNPKSKKYIIFSVISLSLFLLTHNIMTVIFVPVLILWIIYWIWENNKKGNDLLKIATSVLFAFGISSFFLLPAFFEKSLVQTEGLTRFELDFRANFVSIGKLFIDRVWGYGTSIPGPEGGMSFQIGIVHWVLAFLAFILTIFSKIKKEKKILGILIFLLFMLSIFMTHVRSAPVWEAVKILTYFQFPWRFLSLTIFTTAILGGIFVSLLPKTNRIYFVYLICFITFVLNFSYFKPREFYKITDSQKLSGESWDEQRRGAILDYLPKTALEPQEEAPNIPLVISGKADVKNFKNNSNKWKFDAQVLEKSEIQVPVFYFPNWKVYVNDKSYSFNHDNLVGRIAFTLDPGEYVVEGRFENAQLRTFANVVTLLSIFGFLFYVKRFKNK